MNDYGPVRADQIADNAVIQRFGRTTALGINSRCSTTTSAAAASPCSSPPTTSSSLFMRVWCRAASGPRTTEAFRTHFALDALAAREKPAEDARLHRAAGRNDQALDAYRSALARRVRDWHLLGEVAG